ncbi:MAG TPA: AMP-binding protein [Quisquiliibacterium sp.]|nr:AMP-binding protein [Quisquiliibacterium sp.]
MSWDPSSSELTLPPIARRNIGTVFDEALRRAPDKVAVHDPDGQLSYAALHDRALQLGGGFESRGFRVGEHVLLMLDNHLDYVLAWLGLALTGRVEVPVNTAYKGTILAHVVNNSGARAIVVEERYCPLLAEIADRLTTLELVVVRGNASAAGLPGRLKVIAFEEIFGPRAKQAKLEPWDLIGILYTSGTTGLSKGVRVTNAHAYGYATPALFDIDRPDEVTMVTLPLFHIGGQWAGVYKSFIAAATAVVLPRFSATTFWDDVRRYGCTYTLLLGAMANFLYRQPPSPTDRDHSLRRISMVPVIAQLEEFKTRFGIEAVGTGYGLTEGSTILRAPMGYAEPGLAGWLRPDFEARLVDENDIEVPEGEVGELVVRTRDPWSIMDGYHAMPEATVKAWRNQWFHTGDAFRRDACGRWYFLDRLKDAVRRRGENVSSFEVESEINEHPAVLESAVIAVPSDASEDEIKACVVLRPGQSVGAEDLLKFLDARLPYFMVPRYVEFMDRLPKTPTEKVQKQELRSRGITPETYDRQPSGGGKA